MITSLELHNFKCYKQKKIDFSKLTVFCGNNSVGKSTAIQALAILLQSKFANTVSLNGNLTKIGYHKDVYNHDAQDDSILIKIETTEYGRGSWGIKNSKQRDRLKSNTLVFQGSDLAWKEAKQLKILSSYRFQYLQAERYGPRDNFPLSQNVYHENWLGPKGEFTLEVLHRIHTSKRINLSEAPLEFTSGIFAQLLLDLPPDPRKHENANNHDVFENIKCWMGEISPGFAMFPEKNEVANVATGTMEMNGSKPTKTINVGFGLSYCLSIVTALLLTRKGGLVIIENPEAHLHPRGQSYLGRLIGLTAIAGVQVIVETHSDHLLNGIRVVARLNEDYKDGTFKVIYVSKGEEQSELEELPIGSKGELPNWPQGFFDQQALDIKTIIKGENVTEMPRRRARDD